MPSPVVIDRDFVSADRSTKHLQSGYFVISWRFFNDMEERRRSHGKCYEIKSKNASIFRALKFDGGLQSATENRAEIVLDYIGWLELIGYADDINRPIQLTIRRARWYHYPKIAISNPDLTFRLSSWVGIISLALGLLSLALAVWALLRT